MKKDVSIVIPSIRPKNLIKFYNAASNACKSGTFEVVIASPYLIPEELMRKGNVKFLHTYANPTIAIQMAVQLCDSEFIYHTCDDGLIQDGVIDLALHIFRTVPLCDKDMLNMIYIEGILDNDTLELLPKEKRPEAQRENITPFPYYYWIARAHANLQLPGIKDGWKLCCQSFMRLNYFLELGGYDCDWEYYNHPVHDFAFRAQANGSRIFDLPTPAIYSSHLHGGAGDHTPVLESQNGPDEKRFIEIYSNPDAAYRRIKLDYNNWRGHSPIWERRFNKNNLSIYK